MSSPSRDIPDPVKRAVRQRCGFGCVMCGKPLYEYDHVDPWTEVQEHDPENIVLLCDQHHREKTSGLLPVEALEAANADPYSLRAGISPAYDLQYAGDGCEATVGTVTHVTSRLAEETLMIPLLIDDTPIVFFKKQDGHLLLNVQLFNADNELVVQILDNQLAYSATEWDVELVGRTLTVRGGAGDIFVRMTFEPPDRLLIDRGHIWRNGVELEIRPESFVLGNDRNALFVQAEDVDVAVAVGDTPRALSAVIRIGSSRVSFGRDEASEARAITWSGP
jgi:hypothetical protein